MSTDSPTDAGPGRRRVSPWNRLTIQSKLLAMLLLASVLSALVVGYAGYRSGSKALSDAAYERLAAQRGSKAREINNYLNRLQTAAILNSRSATATGAARDFSAAYDELDGEKVTPGQRESLEKYYATEFLPSLQATTGGEPSVQSFFPRGSAELYLQANYTAPYGEGADTEANFDAAVSNDDAGDGSDWSAAHARYHPFFREVVQRNGYEDAMIVRPDGTVVYTAYKGVDLGTNLRTGPFASAQLTKAFDEVLASNDVDAAAVTDFEPYAPSSDTPTAFSMSPIGQDGTLLGVLLLQLPVDNINAVMTNGGEWEASGFGDTGETFLVGPDRTMRSISRELTTDPEAYERDVVRAGTPRTVAERAVRTDNSILIQPITGDAIDSAFEGQSSTTIKNSYRGPEVLVSYAPLGNDLVDWVIVAQVDESEALAPTRDFLRNVAVATLLLILVVTLLSMIAAQVFVRPIRALVSGVRRVAGGDLEARVQVGSGDEFGDLGSSFNQMAATLRSKQELLDAEVAENDRVLLSIMPADVAQRFRAGERNITEDHQDVSVAFITITGLDELGSGRPAEVGMALLNELLNGFDSAADSRGVERVRSLRSGYIASCGLVVPRVDHAQRMVDFARDLLALLHRFNAQHDTQLSLRAGVDSGVVTSGLVGSSSVYDMWGDSVNVAFGVQAASGSPGIYVSARVYDLVRDALNFESAGVVDGAAGPLPVWKLDQEDLA